MMHEQATASSFALEKRVEELAAASVTRTSIPGMPLESRPPMSSDNPWRPVLGSIVDGTLHLDGKISFKLERLDFFPSRDAFPNCYYRLNIAVCSGNRIPAETVILPQTEVSSILVEQARGLGFKQLEKGFMESGQLVFSTPSMLKFGLRSPRRS